MRYIEQEVRDRVAAKVRAELGSEPNPHAEHPVNDAILAWAFLGAAYGIEFALLLIELGL